MHKAERHPHEDCSDAGAVVEPPDAGRQTDASVGQECQCVTRRRHSDEGRMSLLYSDMQRYVCFSRRSSTRRLAGAAGQSSARAAAEAAAARVATAEKSVVCAVGAVGGRPHVAGR